MSHWSLVQNYLDPIIFKGDHNSLVSLHILVEPLRKYTLMKKVCMGHLTLPLNIKHFIEVESGWYYRTILALHLTKHSAEKRRAKCYNVSTIKLSFLKKAYEQLFNYDKFWFYPCLYTDPHSNVVVCVFLGAVGFLVWIQLQHGTNINVNIFYTF